MNSPTISNNNSIFITLSKNQQSNLSTHFNHAKSISTTSLASI